MLRQLVVNYHIQQNELKLCHTSIETPVNLLNGCGGSEIIREKAQLHRHLHSGQHAKICEIGLTSTKTIIL